MYYLAWGLGFALIASFAWLVSAFVLHLGHTGRLIGTVLIPGAVAGTWCWLNYLQTSRGDPGWDALFFVVSIMAGGFVALATLPVWFLAEEKLGWRAR